jgi:hypothetical protein
MSRLSENAAVAATEQNFSPWAIDAKELLRGGDGTLAKSKAWIRDLYLVECDGIKAYRAGTPIVASIRGNGKSAVVNRQAVVLLDKVDRQRSYVPLLGHSPFVSELTGSRIRVPAKALDRLTSTPRWVAIWTCTLLAHIACMVLRGRSMPPKSQTKSRDSSNKDGNQTALRDPDEDVKTWIANELALHKLNIRDPSFNVRDFLFEVFDLMRGHADSLSPAVSYLIEAGLEADTLDEISEVLKRVGKLVEPGQIFAIHADAVDEALGTDQKIRLMDACRQYQEGEGAEKDEAYPEAVARRVWLAYQKGFLVATHRIDSQLPFAKIFGSIRIEAVRNLDGKDLNLLGTNQSKMTGALYSELIYTQSQLKEIFALNVARTDDDDVADLSSDDPQIRLFGFHQLNHSRVYGVNEEILNLMLRHTFGSARDLVLIAKKAKNAATSTQRNTPAGIETIVKSIDSSAATLCSDWMNDVVPGFTAKLDLITRRLGQNIYTIQQTETFEVSVESPGFFAELFSRGLVGYPLYSDTLGYWCMEFKSPDGNDHGLPTGVSYVALHPALSAWVCSMSSDKSLKQKFYTGKFIVGQGVMCPLKLTQPRLCLTVESIGDWTIEVANPAIPESNYRLSNSQTFGQRTALENRRLKFLLLPLILMRWRDPFRQIFYKNDFNNELARLIDIGLLRSEDDKTVYLREITKLFLTDKPEAQTSVNSSIREMDFAMHFERIETSDGSHMRGCELMWRNQSDGHNHWTPVDGNEIQVSVHQSRLTTIQQ